MTTVGLDLGNAFLSVATCFPDRPPEVVADADGHWQIPTVVNYSNELKPRTGEEAQKQLARDPRGTIFDIKKMLGLSFAEVQTQKSNWQFPVVQGKKGGFLLGVKSEGREIQISAQDVLAELFRKLKETAESALHGKAERVVISVPFEFPNEARAALQDASRFSGFTQVSLLADPVSAALAYELDSDDQSGTPNEVLVIDFGTVLRISYLVIDSGIIQIKQNKVINEVSAASIDQQLINHFSMDFKRKTRLDLSESKRSLTRLATEVNRIKTVLSQVQEAQLQIEGLYEGVDLASSVTRARFEGMNGSLFSNMISKIKENLENWKANPTTVILSGGNCKIPKVQQLIQQNFQTCKVLNSINPNDVNAIGAAIHANLLSQRGNDVKEFLTAQSLPASIGIAGHDGAFVPILQKGTITPTKVTKTFANSSEDQTAVYLSVYEGEDPVAVNNRNLGNFCLSGLTTGPVGSIVISVEFLVDAKGVLSVQASSDKIQSQLKFEGVKERQTIEVPQ